MDCDLEATLYTRISNRKILTWIQRITDTSPLLMVVGGYNFNATNGLISDVELVSTKAGNACSKRVRPLPGTIVISICLYRASLLGLPQVASTHGSQPDGFEWWYSRNLGPAITRYSSYLKL